MGVEWRNLYRYWVSDVLAGARLNATHQLLRAVPTDAVTRFGNWIGPIAGRRYAMINRRARATLEALRPDLAPDVALKRMWQSLGRVHAEFAAEERFWEEGRITVEGAHHLERIKAEGRPLIVAGVHLANWETVPIALGFLGYRFLQTYQPQNNRFENRIAQKARERFSARFTAADPAAGMLLVPPTKSASSDLLRSLRNGDAFMMFVDERAGGRVHAPAFGRAIEMDGNIARVIRLARLSGAAVVPAYAVRTEGARFTVTFLPPLPLQATGDRDADLQANMALLDEAITAPVLAHLEQWYMLMYLNLPAAPA